jgi:serine/threonine protein phosphatase PrpC
MSSLQREMRNRKQRMSADERANMKEIFETLSSLEASIEQVQRACEKEEKNEEKEKVQERLSKRMQAMRDYVTQQLGIDVVARDNHIVEHQENVASSSSSSSSSSLIELVCGVSSAQGKRPSMEDAHMCLPRFNETWNCVSEVQSPLLASKSDAVRKHKQRKRAKERKSLLKLAAEGVPFHAFLAVYDGHGGSEAAKCAARSVHHFLAKSDRFFDDDASVALAEAFAMTDKRFLERAESVGIYAGSTAIVAFVRNTTLWCANLGDSRAVMCRAGKAVPLSTDHTPAVEAERKRVMAAGGQVRDNRVNGMLSVTRAFGDLDYKAHKHMFFPSQQFFADPVIAEPEVRRFELTADDQFIILACDGLWDVMTNRAAVHFVIDKLAALRPRQPTEADMARIASELVHQALSRGTTDNVSLILACIQWQ